MVPTYDTVARFHRKFVRAIDNMKKGQAVKFWKELSNSTSAKEVISAFANKRGYGGKRTLVRYSQAGAGFKEGLPCNVIAGKTGWSVRYVEKIMYWWESEFSKAKSANDVQLPDPKTSVAVSSSRIGERYSEHWSRLGEVAEALTIGLEFPKYVEGEQVESRYGGTVWGSWSFSMVQFRNSRFVESPEIHFSAENNALWGYLMRHMDAEFPGFSADFDRFKKTAVSKLKKSFGETNREHPWLRDHQRNREL